MLLLPILASTTLALADYQKFFFSANGTCPGLAWPCVQDSILAACAYDSLTDRHYCCGGAAQGSCRISSPDCLGADGGPSSTQQRCTAGTSSWCCLKETEICTPRIGQINVCIGTQQDAISNVSQDLLNETFSSLSLAMPASTTYAFNATALSAAALATKASAVSSVQSSPSSFSASPTPTKSSDHSDTLRGGTIAGIVVGCIVGFTAIIITGYILLGRHRRVNKSTKKVGNVSEQWGQQKETDSKIWNVSELPVHPALAEMGGGYEAHELPNTGLPSELSTHKTVT